MAERLALRPGGLGRRGDSVGRGAGHAIRAGEFQPCREAGLLARLAVWVNSMAPAYELAR